MLKQCLELIFGGFVSISKKMLEDHLHGGKYAAPDDSPCQESVLFPQPMPIANKILVC